MLKIRLRRMGSRHRPFYRVVVSDSRRTPLSSALDEIGFYDPRKQPSMIELNLERVDHWVSRGAQPSDTVKRLVAKARRAEAAAPAAEEPAAPAAEEAAAPAAEEAAAAEETAVAEAAAEETAEAASEQPAAEQAEETEEKEG
ncbi:MAG: 30S ribosomal protein S16 [Acidobacteriota bacterium]